MEAKIDNTDVEGQFARPDIFDKKPKMRAKTRLRDREKHDDTQELQRKKKESKRKK